MARDHARIYLRIWSDAQFKALSSADQRMYFVVLSDPQLTHCGVGPLMLRRWGQLAADTSERTVRKSIETLTNRGYLVVDRDTEEVLIRTFMRWDKVLKQPNVARSAYLSWRSVQSPQLRTHVLHEVHRIHSGDPSEYAEKTWGVEFAGEWLAEPLPEPLPEGFLEGFAKPFPLGFPEPPACARPSPSLTPSPSLAKSNGTLPRTPPHPSEPSESLADRLHGESEDQDVT